MSENNGVTESRRGFLTLGLKALAIVVPAAVVLASKPQDAAAVTYRRARVHNRRVTR
jgi:hypothetical protein